MIEFCLPSLGSDMDKGTLLEWRVRPGDAVKKGDVVAVVDTTKAAIDVECWHDGTVAALLIEPGTEIAVNTPIAVLLETGETASELEPRIAALRAAAAQPPGPPAMPEPARAPAASPAARKRAAELGLDLAQLKGTGEGSVITLADVEAAGPVAKPPPSRADAMRQTIAAAMARSKREIPHYYLAEDIPLAAAVELLARLNTERGIADRLLLAPLLLRAVALALRRYPEFNGFYRDGGFVPGAGIHLGVAISLRTGGLIAPALHDTADKDLETLNRELLDLVQRTRAGSLKSSELSDATITVTNLGDQGVHSVFPIIYPPQVAIAGFGRVVERPWLVNGALRAVPLVGASLGADHRVSDGHRGGLFLAALRELLQQPEELVRGKP